MKQVNTIIAVPLMLIGYVLMMLGALVMYIIDAIGLFGADDFACDEHCIADCYSCYKATK